MSVLTFETTTNAALRPKPFRVEAAPTLESTATPAVNRYDHAVTLVDQMRSSIREVTDRKGPRAKINALDVYLSRHEWARFAGGFGYGVIGFGAGITALILAANSGAESALYAGAVTVVSSALSFFCASGEMRVDRKQARHDREKFDSDDIDRMLAPYTKAEPEDRAVIEHFVRHEIAYLDDSLSPKAALRRDQLLTREASATPEDPQLARARTLACAIRALRDATGDYHHRIDEQKYITLIELVIDESPADERRQIAATLEKMLFAGEHPTFKATVATQRQLYAAILKAARGEPIKGEEPTSEEIG